MSLKNAIGGILLIAGTTIGAAVLAFPVDTAQLGLPLTLLYFLLCWVFLTLGALYILETNLQIGFGTNLISMAKATLGLPGQIITWVAYLILLYALTAAYLTGAAEWMREGFGALGFSFQKPLTALMSAGCVSILLIFGTHIIDLTNRCLMFFLIAIFISLSIIALPHVQADYLLDQTYHIDFAPLPLLITGFGFAIIVPTLTNYLHGHAKQLRNVILIGSLFPLILYIIWTCLIMGVLPQEGTNGLLAIKAHQQPAVDLPRALAQTMHHAWLTELTRFFSVFALVTSILGVSLSLMDFLADGFQIKKTKKSKLALCGIIFIPPLVFVLFYPSAFTKALSFAGIYVAIILGILPALMVYKGRRDPNLVPSPFRTWGGTPLIGLSIVFFMLIIVIELASLWGISLRL